VKPIGIQYPESKSREAVSYKSDGRSPSVHNTVIHSREAAKYISDGQSPSVYNTPNQKATKWRDTPAMGEAHRNEYTYHPKPQRGEI